MNGGEARRGEARQGELHCAANKGRTSAHDAAKRDLPDISNENCEASAHIVITVTTNSILALLICYSSACMLVVG